MSKNQMEEKHKIEELWLLYFNDSLFERGIITEEERNAMCIKIKNRRSY